MQVYGDVAQLARASGSYPAGRKFESHRRYQHPREILDVFYFEKIYSLHNRKSMLRFMTETKNRKRLE